MDGTPPLVIVGGGLAGSLTALALHEERPDLPLQLLEADDHFGGNHVWSYFDTDLDKAGHELVAPLGPTNWPAHRIEFPKRRRYLDIGYNSITSKALDEHVRATLPTEKIRLNASVAELAPDKVTLAGGETIDAFGVIDARGPAGPMKGLELGWQKFVGVEYRVKEHGLTHPIIMDGTVEQIDGYRFVYSLPFSDNRIFVEDTYYSDTPDLDLDGLKKRIHTYAYGCGWEGEAVHEETGVLPVVIKGNPKEFWPETDPVPRLGLTGGFFHPTTGYSLPFAISNALDMAKLDDFSSASISSWGRKRFFSHWSDGSFYRKLNRMLFRAAKPEKRMKIFEHFYRLDEPTVSRFYGHGLNKLDKARILSGRPPVNVGKALKALFS